LKDQAAASESSPGPDLKGPPDSEKQERWGWLREVRDLTKDVRLGEIAQKCTAVQVDSEQIRGDGEVAVMRQSLAALWQEWDAHQQLTESEKEDRRTRSQWANQSQATQLPPKTRRNGPTGAAMFVLPRP
jgi:hypothetical protein